MKEDKEIERLLHALQSEAGTEGDNHEDATLPMGDPFTALACGAAAYLMEDEARIADLLGEEAAQEFARERDRWCPSAPRTVAAYPQAEEEGDYPTQRAAEGE